MHSNRAKILFITICIMGICYPMNPMAQSVGAEEGQPPAVFKSIWSAAKLYENNDNAFIQSFALVGRYHGQYWWASSDDHRGEDWENRRFYIGFNTKAFRQFTLEVQISISDDFDPVYDGLYDAFIKWERADKAAAVSIGRLDYVYTGMERTTSSKKIKTMERALIVNQVMPGEVVGVYAKGQIAGLTYQTGLFSGSIEDEFTSFVGDFAALLGFSYAVPLFYQNGTLHLDYLFNNGDPDNNAFEPYRHILSFWHEGHIGPLTVGIDVTAAHGIGDQSDVLGLTVLPTYDLLHNLFIDHDKLQLALRYHYAASEDRNGLEFNSRYEQTVASGSGDSYHAGYLGFNYYIFGHHLKLMAGVQYFDMSGVNDGNAALLKSANQHVDGWEVVTGVRLYF